MTIVAVSADPPEESARLATNHPIRLTLLSDPDLEVTRRFGVAMDGRDIAVPSTFLVCPDGRIAWRYVGETQFDRPKVDEVLALAGDPATCPPAARPERR